MQFVRRLLVWMATSVFTFLLLLTVLATAIAIIITPTHIKGWLKDSGAYSGFVDAALKSLPHDTSKAVEDDLLAQPGVQAAAKKAFTPELLQSSTENFIDGTFVWVEGKSPKPTFNIDLSGAKQAFATGIGDYALQRYNSLPLCTTGQVPATSDILSVECRVAGVDITPAINQKVQEITANKDLLDKPVITPDTLEANGGQPGQQPFYQNFSQLPRAYRWSRVAPYILGVLAILAAVVIIIASTSKRRALRRIAMPLIWVSILLFGSMWLVNYGLNKIDEAKITNENAVASLAQTTAVSIAHNVGKHLNTVYLWFAIGFLLLGGGILIALYFTRDKTPKAPQDKPETPKISDKKEVKPEATTPIATPNQSGQIVGLM